MRRTLSVLILALLVGLPAARLFGSVEDRPNIVLILCDDMGWSDIGCYGGEVETPHIDRLAAEGMRFTQFYNNAKCTTTRASLVTGLYPRRGPGGLLRPNMVTLGEILKSAGYRTTLSGKWHLGRGEHQHPYFRGFDEYYGLLDGCCNFFDPSRPDPDYKGNRVRYFGHNDQRITEFPEGFYTTDAFTDHAIETIRRYHGEGKPFFLHLCYTAPHYPLHAWPEDIAKYRGRFRKGWEAMRRDRYRRQIEMGLIDPETWPLSGTDSRAYEWKSAEQDFEDHRMAVYAAMIDRMDQNIGRLLKTLEEIGVEDNTLVLFLSDNGGCAEEPGGRDPTKRTPGPVDDYVAVGPAWGWAQNAPFRRYKSWVHEGGICTPLIARWPGKVPAGTITRQVGHIIDVLPTLCDVAGADYPAQYGGRDIIPVEGTSLLPVLLGREREEPEFLAWEWAGNRAYRQGDWKVAWDKLVKSWELYDLAADRTETRDLAAAEPARTRAMAKAWFDWAERTGLRVKDRKLPAAEANRKTSTSRWPQFRGPGARGVSPETGLPQSWSPTENVTWSVPVSGRGWSSPIVWDGRVFLTTAVSEGDVEPAKKGLYYGGERKEPSPHVHRWITLCLDAATGKLLWKQTAHEGVPPEPVHIKNTYASETPVTDGDRVYAYFGNTGLFVYDLAGRKQWERRWESRETRHGWGTAASPVLHGDRLYIVNDNEERSFIVALDARSGDVVWELERDEGSNWSTPFVWENSLRTEIVTPGTGKTRSYDLGGGLLWTLGSMSSITIATPYAAHGLLFVTSGFILDPRKPIYAIRPGGAGDLTLPEGETSSEQIAWTHPLAAPYNPSTIVYGDLLYILFDRGFLACLDAKTGEEIYSRKRLQRQTPGYTSSPWAYEGKIFCLSEDGVTHVIRAGKEFEVLSRNELGEMCMATPAIAGGSLFIRTESRLYCIRKE